MSRASQVFTGIPIAIAIYVLSSGPVVSALSYGIRNDPAHYSFYCHCYHLSVSLYEPLSWVASAIGAEDALNAYRRACGYEFPFRN